jgi:hypothetical protein
VVGRIRHAADAAETFRRYAAVFRAHAVHECLGQLVKCLDVSGSSEVAVTAIRDVRLFAVAASRVVNSESIRQEVLEDLNVR